MLSDLIFHAGREGAAHGAGRRHFLCRPKSRPRRRLPCCARFPGYTFEEISIGAPLCRRHKRRP